LLIVAEAATAGAGALSTAAAQVLISYTVPLRFLLLL
jgi:hypothetical protein